MVQAKVNGWIVRAGWTGFWGGGRVQAPSLPAADRLTSDGNGFYFTYTSTAITEGLQSVLNWALAGILVKDVFWPVIPLAGLVNDRYSGCVERQVTGRTRSFAGMAGVGRKYAFTSGASHKFNA